MLLQCIREAQESEERKKMIAQMKEEEKEMHEQALEQIKTNIRQKRLERSQARKERLKAASSMTVAEKQYFSESSIVWKIWYFINPPIIHLI